MKRVITSGLLALPVWGCASSAVQRQQEAWQQAGRIMMECRQKRVSGELSSHIASVQCSNVRAQRVITESGYPYVDLVNLLAAYRMAAARRIDERKYGEPGDGTLCSPE